MALRVPDLLDRSARAYSDKPALKVKRGGGWQTISWREYREQVRLAARALMALGVEPGECVVLIGANSPEWFIGNVGAIAAGGIPAGIYTTSTAEQCKYIAQHCEARVAFVENAAQLAKFRAIRSELPALRAIVQMIGDPDGADVLSWKKFL